LIADDEEWMNDANINVCLIYSSAISKTTGPPKTASGYPINARLIMKWKQRKHLDERCHGDQPAHIEEFGRKQEKEISELSLDK
jgi:hypothetical protein